MIGHQRLEIIGNVKREGAMEKGSCDGGAKDVFHAAARFSTRRN
jgi:hypothetical protein